MEEVEFKFNPEEAAIICASLSIRIQEGTVDADEAAKMKVIMGKLSEPFGFTAEQMRDITKLMFTLTGGPRGFTS